MGRRNPWMDRVQILFGYRDPGLNHVYQIWWRSVEGFLVGGVQKFALSHWLWWSSLQQCYATACTVIWLSWLFFTNFCFPNRKIVPIGTGMLFPTEWSFGWGSKNWLTFRLGKHKLVKNNQDNQIRSITFRKRYTQCTMGLGQSPRSWGIFENFCVKNNLHVKSVRLLLTISYKKWGTGCTSCSPNNFVGEQLLPPAPPVPAPMFDTVVLNCFKMDPQETRVWKIVGASQLIRHCRPGLRSSSEMLSLECTKNLN